MFRSLLFVACSALAACGQTGQLYPQPEPDALAGAAPNVSAQGDQ